MLRRSRECCPRQGYVETNVEAYIRSDDDDSDEETKDKTEAIEKVLRAAEKAGEDMAQERVDRRATADRAPEVYQRMMQMMHGSGEERQQTGGQGANPRVQEWLGDTGPALQVSQTTGQNTYA